MIDDLNDNVHMTEQKMLDMKPKTGDSSRYLLSVKMKSVHSEYLGREELE